MTYTESSDLMNDMVFRGRVKVACLNFAAYISGEGPATPAHSSRMKWAQSVWQMPDTVAQNITPPTVMEPLVQAGGAAVSDADLQTSVETVVNKVL